jgi:hypothetical protein
MQKNYTLKAFFLSTLFFVLLAFVSFAAFRDPSQVYTCSQTCFKIAAPAQEGGMLWEVVFRQFLSLISI